jgi:tripartite-type tricarboxylate transporter receptor subunit TctC
MRLRLTVAALALLAAAAKPAATQSWPNRSVSMVVPFAAGAASDVVGRILAARMSEILGQQIIVENVGGAGGMTGVARVAKAAPDGYQFVLGGLDTFAQNQALYKHPLYRSVSDFQPIALTVEQPLVLLVRNGLAGGDLKGFMAYAKANQANMRYGSAGVGSSSHLGCAQLNVAMGVNVTHIPYRGSPQALQDLAAGRIDYFCALAAAAMPQIGSPTMKAMTIMTRNRSPVFPDLPSADEQGLTDFDSYSWFGFFVPRATPAPIVQALHAASVATLDTPSVSDRLRSVGVTVVAPDRRSPDYLRGFLEREIEKWTEIIRSNDISLE